MPEESKVLLVVDPQALTVPLSRFSIKHWGPAYALNLVKAFSNHGINVKMESVIDIQNGNTPRLKDGEKFNHALVIINHSSKMHGEILFTNLRKLLMKGGLIGQMGDDDVGVGFEDIRFHASSIEPNISPNKKIQVLWAADPEIWFPKKDDNILKILVDSQYFDDSTYDKTVDILRECIKFANNPDYLPNGKEKVEIYGYGRYGLKKFTKEKDLAEVVCQPPAIPQNIYLRAFRTSDIFFISHSESMGLSVIEAGMAGCLVVIPAPYNYTSFIKPDLAETVISFSLIVPKKDFTIPWEKILSKIDSDASVKFAKRHTWDKLGKMVLEGFNTKSSEENRLIIRDSKILPTDTSLIKEENKIRWLMESNINFINNSTNKYIVDEFMFSWLMDKEFCGDFHSLSDFSQVCINQGWVIDEIGMGNIEDDDQKRKIAVGNILINVLKLSSDDLDSMPGFTERDLNLISEELYLSSQTMGQARLALLLADNESEDYHSWSTGRMLYEGKRGRFDLHEKWIELEPECKDPWVVCMRSYWNTPNRRGDCLRIGEKALKHFPDDEWINDIVNKCRVQLS